MKDLARCRYCDEVMPEFGEAEGLNYAHMACSLKHSTIKMDCFKGKVIKR